MTTAEEERHVYFGEKYCSDVQLKYNNTYYHVHKAVLASESKRFRYLFESKADVIELEPFVFPGFLYNGVPNNRLELFLSYFYTRSMNTLLTSYGCILTSIECLAHYFQCESLESKLQVITVVGLSSKQYNFGVGYLLTTLHEAESFHWMAVKDKVMEMLIQKFVHATDNECKADNFRHISVETKIALLKGIFNVSKTQLLPNEKATY